MVSKAKNSKKSRSLLKNFVNKIKGLSLGAKVLLLIIIAVLSFVAYRQTTIFLEKRDILAKQQKLEELADKITLQYPPDARSSERYCEYSHQKFSKGDLSCVVGIILEYKNVDSNKSTLYKDNISQENNLATNEVAYNMLGSSKFTKSPDNRYWNSFISNIEDGSHCNILYSYDDSSGNNILKLKLTCSFYPVKSEHFVVRK